MTQRQRVLRALEAAGSTGITPVDFTGPETVDGGSPILRVAPRVDELRKEGYRISTYRQPNGVARYVLVPGHGGFEMPARDDGGLEGPHGGHVRASESPAREGQRAEVVVTPGAPVDLPSEGLFSTDEFKRKPGYPR